ncbi:MAG: hypothetical protein QG639_950 [Patescibacteria group bacterium]|jgi:glycine/D-amino acid oxidase-like deaminating enzyme|nr:hypothetical protein [Patescibacteria group bacterium]
MSNFSPWIQQLPKNRQVTPLSQSMDTDIVVVGGGIAGITTAYFILANTSQRVVLLESSKVAHGATGHNAGQIVSYFERQVSEMVKEFGLELTADAQRAIDSAWSLLEEIYAHTQISTPFSQFRGFAGCQDLDEILVHLENIIFCKNSKLVYEPIMIAEESDVVQKIPEKYKECYSVLPHKDILQLLETNNPKFIAVLAAKKGCMNSALFCEDLLAHLLSAYSDRFKLFEDSHVKEVVLKKNSGELKVRDKIVSCKRIVLCTNGFEKFKITNTVGKDIDKSFHHLVQGSVGYMAGYLEKPGLSPIAISYLPPRVSDSADNAQEAEPYFYLTRRPFENNNAEHYNLVCVGGPESLMDDTNNYQKEHPYPEEAQEQIDTFLHQTYAHSPEGPIEYQFKWHGLMGYTPNGVRCVGVEPANPVLLYNLGCNGVGILPSIYGSKRISEIVKGTKISRSIFDPKGTIENKIKSIVRTAFSAGE